MKRITGLVAAATVVATVPASAAPVFSGNPCITAGGFTACASVLVDVVGTVATVQVTNQSGVQGNSFYILTGFGFYYFGTTGTLTQATGPTGWANQATWITPAVSGGTWMGGSAVNGVPNGIGHGLTGTWTFNITGGIDWSNTHFMWRGQSWQDATGAQVGSGSIKCYDTGETADSYPGVPADCGDVPILETPVPEPASMMLLATGLVGLAGAGYVRRRKRGA